MRSIVLYCHGAHISALIPAVCVLIINGCEQALGSMPLLHLLPGKERDAGVAEPVYGPLSRHVQLVLQLRLCDVCTAVLQWLEQAVASTSDPEQRPLRTPVDYSTSESSPLPTMKYKSYRKLHMGRIRKVCMCHPQQFSPRCIQLARHVVLHVSI